MADWLFPSVTDCVYSIDYTRYSMDASATVYISSTVTLTLGLDCEWQANGWVRQWVNCNQVFVRLNSAGHG